MKSMIELNIKANTKNIKRQWLAVQITHNKTIYSIVSFKAIGKDSLTTNFIMASVKPNVNMI